MVLGFLTRKVLITRMGPVRFARLAPVFPIASMLAMFAIIFLIFYGKSTLIIDKWPTVLLLLVPNALFIAITPVFVTWLDHRLGLPYQDHMAVVFASTGKNNGTAIAIAATAFSPLVAIPAATMPIFQVILLIGYLKMADRIPGLVPAAPPAPPPTRPVSGRTTAGQPQGDAMTTMNQQPTLDQVMAKMTATLNGTLPMSVQNAATAMPDMVLRHAADSAFAMPPEGGALTPETRTLIYLAVALATGSHACVQAMTNKAQAQGINREQLLETFKIARFAEATRVFGNAEYLLAHVHDTAPA